MAQKVTKLMGQGSKLFGPMRVGEGDIDSTLFAQGLTQGLRIAESKEGKVTRAMPCSLAEAFSPKSGAG